MNYGDLLMDSLRITLRNRFLWFFGLFAGAGGGSLGVPSNSGGTFPEETEKSMPSLGTLVEPARRWVAENLVTVSLVVGLVLLVTLVFVAVGALCAGALAESVAAIDRGVGRRFVSTFNAGLSVLPPRAGARPGLLGALRPSTPDRRELDVIPLPELLAGIIPFADSQRYQCAYARVAAGVRGLHPPWE